MDANENFVAGVSSDSTVCIWDRKTGELKGKASSRPYILTALQVIKYYKMLEILELL